MLVKEGKKFTVVRDGGREKKDYWSFEPDKYCNGTIDKTLKTGDYSILEFSDISLERKRTVGEIYNNLFEDRFYREMVRLSEFKYKAIVCQFDLKTILSFPVNSGIPGRFWSGLKSNGNYILSKLMYIQVKYGIHILFGGLQSKDIAYTFLKQVAKTEGLI